MPLVSIIVPVYKAEKWLHRCVDSILAQTMKDFELLLIDDGSPDRSGEICDEYAAKDSRVRVFHKENGGVSSARNLGLDNAQGEWISFVDADDWVEIDYLARLTENLDADFILGGVKISDNQQSNLLDHKYEKSEIKDCIERYLFDTVLLSPWGNLLRNDILQNNHIRFDEKIHYAEDRVFNRQYLLCCREIRTIFYSNYYYTFIEQNIDYVDKYDLSIIELDYLCNQIQDLNIKLKENFGVILDNNELRNYILVVFLSDKSLCPENFWAFYDLCRKYYLDLTISDFCASTTLSTIFKYLGKIKKNYCECNYLEAKKYFNKLNLLSNQLPIFIKFRYRSYCLWYFLIKCGWWRIFDCLMKLYCRLK